MADRSRAEICRLYLPTVTLAVMLTTGMVVKGYADGAYTLESTTIATARFQLSLTIEACGSRVNSLAAPDQRHHHDGRNQQSDEPEHDGPHSVRR